MPPPPAPPSPINIIFFNTFSVDTATLDDLREKHAETFEIICLQLDHDNDWPALGKKIGISNEKLKQIRTSSSCAQTVLEIIEKKNPIVTVKDMRDVLSLEMERQDVCQELNELSGISYKFCIIKMKSLKHLAVFKPCYLLAPVYIITRALLA